MGLLREDLLIFSEKATKIISHSGEIILTLGNVYLTLGDSAYYFHIVADDYPLHEDGVISREVIQKLVTEQRMQQKLTAENGSSKQTCEPPDKVHALRGNFMQSRNTCGNQRPKINTHSGNNAESLGQFYQIAENTEANGFPCYARNEPPPQNWQFQNGGGGQTGRPPRWIRQDYSAFAA